jgi:hypothetical protein
MATSAIMDKYDELREKAKDILEMKKQKKSWNMI